MFLPPRLVLIHGFHFHLFLEFTKVPFKTKNKFSSGEKKKNLLSRPYTVFMFVSQDLIMY